MIGRYEVVRELGRGGMATVYLARDPSFERQVAIKVLPPQFTRDPHYLARFRREAKFIASLEHPYIVPVYDYGQDNGQPFIVMRYMPGRTLADRMKGRPMPPAEVAPIIMRLAEALDEAHSQGVIHRDLKPTNVMFDTRGQAYLSDFGIAKVLHAEGDSATVDSLTGSGIIGTPAYMSPEQAVGEKGVDQRSDIYSFGIILYEMLVGRHPYEADTPMKVLFKHVHDPVPQLDLAELSRLGLPQDINALLAQALAKQPAERFSTATDLSHPLIALSVSGLWKTVDPLLSVRPHPALTPAPTSAPTVVSTPTRPSLRLRLTQGVAMYLERHLPGDRADASRPDRIFLLSQILIWLFSGLLFSLALSVLSNQIFQAISSTPVLIVPSTATTTPTMTSVQTSTQRVVVFDTRTSTVTPTIVTMTPSSTFTPTPSATLTSTMTATPTPTPRPTPVPTRVPPTLTASPVPATNTPIPDPVETQRYATPTDIPLTP